MRSHTREWLGKTVMLTVESVLPQQRRILLRALTLGERDCLALFERDETAPRWRQLTRELSEVEAARAARSETMPADLRDQPSGSGYIHGDVAEFLETTWTADPAHSTPTLF